MAKKSGLSVHRHTRFCYGVRGDESYGASVRKRASERACILHIVLHMTGSEL